MKLPRRFLVFLHNQLHALRFRQARRRALKGSRWDRLSRAERHRIAVRSGVSASLADTWARIRFRNLPEGWRETILENCR
jgi:hypothetical protein